MADPRVAVAPDGSFVVVWKQLGLGDIMLQRFDTAGLPIGSNVIVNDDAGATYQNQPSVAASQIGSYVAAWLDYRTGGFPSDPQIYCQAFEDTVTVGTNRLLTSTVTFRDAPDVALAPDGSGMVVWSEYRSSKWGVYGQLITSAGVPSGTSFRINDFADSARHAPRVAASARSWYVVAWEDKRYGNNDIFAQRLASDGRKLGTNVRVNTDATGTEQLSPDVATDGVGRFTVVWVDYRNASTAPDIYASRRDTNMLEVATNQRLSTEVPARQQKFPSIAADRMGNVAVVWSQLNGSYWDVLGRMIDVDGVTQDLDFSGSTSLDSNQIKPDVALDGAYRYVVWMDNRENRSYDIYGSITRYNDRALSASPLAVSFFMHQGGPLPQPQYVRTSHAGYNPIGYEIAPFGSWISVTPSGGTTPDSFAIGIASADLEHGSYDGVVRVIDPITADSSLSISVHLDVNAAILALSADTIRFAMPVGYDTVLQHNLLIENSGQGSLTWAASEEASWLSLSASEGIAPALISLSAAGRSLTVGEYSAEVIINAGLADGSPDTVVVELSVRNDIPVIAVDPVEISAALSGYDPFDTVISVTNVGGGFLDWTVSGVPSWLTVLPLSGSGNGEFAMSVNHSALTEGINSAVIAVSDPESFNQTARVDVEITYEPPLVDTVFVGSATVPPGGTGVVDVTTHVNNRLASILIPLRYDAGLITIDSIRFGAGLPLAMERYSRIEPSVGVFLLRLEQTAPDVSLEPGAYTLAEIFFTAGSEQGPVVIDTLDTDTLSPVATIYGGGVVVPEVAGGLVIIDQATGIDDGEEGNLSPLVLMQNYPNPFNSETVVSFSLPDRTLVKLEVYNVLGRRVAMLAEGVFGQGSHQVVWAGEDETGREAPTGVYFYRLQTPDTALVAKMILMK